MASAHFLTFLHFPCFCLQQHPQSLIHTRLPSLLTKPSLARAVASGIQCNTTASASSQDRARRQLREATLGRDVSPMVWMGCALAGAPATRLQPRGARHRMAQCSGSDPAHSCLAFQSKNARKGDHSSIHLGAFC